jgi:hypothetical protein
MKREKKFTHGPWSSDGNPEFYPLISSNNGDLVSQVFHADGEPDDNIDIEQCGANAHLIAAAPELLEALEFMIDRFECRRDNLFSQRKACLDARTAINKAYGE